MNDLSRLSDKKILVAGLGSTGLSALAYCHHIGADTAAYDAAVSPERAAELRSRFPNLSLFSDSLRQALHQKDVLILSPGISRRLPEIVEFEQNGGTVCGDIAILSALLRGSDNRIIAVTGSNGKTTVTSLIGHLCQACGCDTLIAGNIGTPVLDTWLARGGRGGAVWVLELSSFQLETTPYLNASAALCLNVSEDHLDRYDDLLDYARAKDQIFNGNGVQILNADDPFCRAMKRNGRTVHYFSLRQSDGYHLDRHSGSLKHQHSTLLEHAQLPLQGEHNAANVLAALAACEAIGLPRERLLQAVPQFQGLPHRVQNIGEKNGIRFIDDSKGTNVGATVAAIAGLPETIVLIAGGQGKGQDFSPLKNVLQNKARAIFLIGADANAIARDIDGCGVPITFCSDLPDAVRQAYAAAHTGDSVLLSPACASFDMFNGYAHRAEVFAQTFNTL